MKRELLLAALCLCIAGEAIAGRPKYEPIPPAANRGQSILQKEKERFFSQATETQTGTVERFTVGRVLISPYNPASDLTGFLVPQVTPIYQGQEKVTLESLVPGAAVRIHFRFSPVSDQPARAVAIEILSVSQSRAARMQALQSPPVQNEGRGQITGVPPPEKAEILADASTSMQGRIEQLDGRTILIAAEGQPPRRLRLDPYVSVFEGPYRVGTDLLAPGRDVRVFLRRGPTNTTPIVIAVDLLKFEELQTGPSK